MATGAGGSAGGGGNGDGLYYDASSTEFVCGDHRIKADIFNEFIDDEVRVTCTLLGLVQNRLLLSIALALRLCCVVSPKLSRGDAWA